MGGKSPGEEVGSAGPGQRTEHLGSRAEALAGQEVVGWGAQGGVVGVWREEGAPRLPVSLSPGTQPSL